MAIIFAACMHSRRLFSYLSWGIPRIHGRCGIKAAARCDRQTSDNKGGAMIYICSNMCSFTSPDIEVACGTVTLTNANHMQALVPYRSPR